MTIYIDADACPVTRIAEDIARRHEIDWVRVYQKEGAPDTTVEDLLTSTPWELVKVTEDWGDGSADMTDAAGNKITFNKNLF